MGFLSKLYESVRVNGTLVDHPNDNEIYNASTQTVGSGSETFDASVVNDGAGVSHTDRLLDLENSLGISWSGDMQKTEGSSATASLLALGPYEIRVPGEAASNDEARVFDPRTEFDPSVSTTVRFNLSNLTVDNSSSAILSFIITDAPDTGGPQSGSDFLYARIGGNATIFCQTGNDGSAGSSSDSTQDNAFINSISYVELDWDGSTLNVEISDGTTTVNLSESTNYPTGETLFLKVAGRDNDGSNPQNVDFDVDSIEVR